MNRTVDIALLVGDKVCLIRRAKPPFENRWVLPGGHIEPGESPIQAAVRELEEEVGVRVSPEILWFLCTLDSPGRDPRGEKISTVFTVEVTPLEWSCARAGSDAKTLGLFKLEDLKPEIIGFDHWIALEILRRIP